MLYTHHHCQPLHLATHYGHLECVKILLTHESIDVNVQDRHNVTALHQGMNDDNVRLYPAAYTNHHEIMAELLKKTPNVNAVDNKGRYVRALRRHDYCGDGRRTSITTASSSPCYYIITSYLVLRYMKLSSAIRLHA